MKNLFLLLLFTLLFLLSSCDSFYKLTPGYWKLKSEFKKEREFVQKILDNPYQMQEIVESSEFYDKAVLDMGSASYRYWIECFTQNRDGTKAEIIWFGRKTRTDGKGSIIYDNAKGVDIFSPNAEFNISFLFIESEERTLLAEITGIARY